MASPRLDLSLEHRLSALPHLGVGISGEYGVRPSIDPLSFDQAHRGLIHFVEFGSDADRGLDPSVLAWVDAGRKATYHFLDVNFEEFEDLDPAWMATTKAFAERLKAPWLCGDSGLWHFGPRDRGHGLLLPPVLTSESAEATAKSIRHLMAETGLMVLPENPPSLYWLGDLHILDYFAAVSERADCGLLLDIAHLVIFQKAHGLAPTDGLSRFPLDRVIEIHMAGGGDAVTADGFRYIDDDHRAEIHADAWEVLDYVLPRAPHLKAICYECEHEQPTDVIPVFERLNALFPLSGALP